MTSVFVVGVSDAEANHIVSIHKTYEGALNTWNKVREELIKTAKEMKFYNVSRGYCHSYDSDINKDIDALQCDDPTKIDNYPQDTPYINKYKILP